MEASFPQKSGQNAKLVLPSFTGSVCFWFYRHMHGKNIGSLRLKVNSVKKLERNGDHGNKWIADAVDIFGINAKVNKSTLLLA